MRTQLRARRDLSSFSGAGYDKGRSLPWQVAWFATMNLVFTKWWLPPRFRPAILRAFGAWLDVEPRTALPKSPFGQAVSYAINQWPTLGRYLGDARFTIGRVERWRGSLGQAHPLPALSSAGASLAWPCPVSTSRSSNRTCGFPASGSHSDPHAFAFGVVARRSGTRKSPSSSYR